MPSSAVKMFYIRRSVCVEWVADIENVEVSAGLTRLSQITYKGVSRILLFKLFHLHRSLCLGITSYFMEGDGAEQMGR